MTFSRYTRVGKATLFNIKFSFLNSCWASDTLLHVVIMYFLKVCAFCTRRLHRNERNSRVLKSLFTRWYLNFNKEPRTRPLAREISSWINLPTMPNEIQWQRTFPLIFVYMCLFSLPCGRDICWISYKCEIFFSLNMFGWVVNRIHLRRIINWISYKNDSHYRPHHLGSSCRLWGASHLYVSGYLYLLCKI